MLLWCCRLQTPLAFHVEEWDSSPLSPTNIFKESWALQITPKWCSVVFTIAVAFSCSENLSFQIIFELSDDFIEFISLGKRFWKLFWKFSDMTRDRDRKQLAKQPQRRINIIMHLRWRLLRSGIEICALYWKSIIILEVPQRTEPSQFSLSKVNPIQLANLNLHISFKQPITD